ncbi:hypothetical protein EXIGLDRAFT_696038 [Exidia glandulosa HHB12029]|uniref:Uncharacterized protein n=1 Tax=Exidia glandulosa HHB12029 TaxID=1314781 RepID=A0A165N7M8_EXIGL|nr:hypothetical protein EXIGLDRAFT_696038 [Exidia glandulosa HHB12029]
MVVFSKLGSAPCIVANCGCPYWEKAGEDTMDCKRCRHWDVYHTSEDGVVDEREESAQAPPDPGLANGQQHAQIRQSSSSTASSTNVEARLNHAFAEAVAAAVPPSIPNNATQRSASGSSASSDQSRRSSAHGGSNNDMFRAARAESLENYRPKKAKAKTATAATSSKKPAVVKTKTYTFKRIVILPLGLDDVPTGVNGLPAYGLYNIALPSLAAISDAVTAGNAYEPADGETLSLEEGGTAADVAALVDKYLPLPMAFLRQTAGSNERLWRLMCTNNNGKSLQILGGPPPRVQDVVDATKAKATPGKHKLPTIWLISGIEIPAALVGNWDSSDSRLLSPSSPSSPGSEPSRSPSPEAAEPSGSALGDPAFHQPEASSSKRRLEDETVAPAKRRRLSPTGSYAPVPGFFSGLASTSALPKPAGKEPQLQSPARLTPDPADIPERASRAMRVQAFNVGKTLRKYTEEYEPSSPV